MNIVFVTGELEAVGSASGGLGRFTANMINIFHSRGHKVSVILVTRKYIRKKYLLPVEVQQVAPEETKIEMILDFAKRLFPENVRKREDTVSLLVTLEQNWLLRKRIAQINAEEEIDIVHYCNHGAFALLADRRIPHVVRISSFFNMTRKAREKEAFSDNYYDCPLSMEEKIVDFMLRRTRALISPSKKTSSIAEALYGHKVPILESPFILDEKDWDYAVYNKYLKGKKYILHAGRLEYLKGTHILAQVVYEILDKNPDLYIIMAGSAHSLYDEQEKIYLSAQELVRRRAGKYSDRVLYLGQLVRNSLYPIIKNAEISFQPSRFDNLPNACIEAMAMRTLVIGTNKASYEQLIEDGKSGFLGERDQPNTYMCALEKALSLKKEEKQKILDRAENRIHQLRPDKVYRKYLKYYNYVIESWENR